MILYRVQIELKSPLVTALKGDTIWGHVAWGVANNEGDEGIKSFLQDCKGESPSFVVSSAFPAGFICKRIPELEERKENLSKDDYAKIKQRKKEKYAKASDYLDVEDVQGDGKNVFIENTVTHNTISRFTNTVEEGGLYSVEELWAEKGKEKFDFYVLSSYTKDRVQQLCTWAFENGFGADSSVGKGNIEVLSVNEVKPKFHGSKYMALSPFVVPNMSEIEDLRADIFIRSGKIGGSFANCIAPWKKTVVLYNEGAVFTSKKPLQYIGKLLENVHTDSRICQSGFSIVIPIE